MSTDRGSVSARLFACRGAVLKVCVRKPPLPNDVVKTNPGQLLSYVKVKALTCRPTSKSTTPASAEEHIKQVLWTQFAITVTKR